LIGDEIRWKVLEVLDRPRTTTQGRRRLRSRPEMAAYWLRRRPVRGVASRWWRFALS